MRSIVFILLCLILAGCNSIYMKPGTLDTNEMIYTPRGGETMKRSIKQIFDERGYKTHVGKLTSVHEGNSKDFEIYSQSKNIKYSVIVNEKTALLRPIWCIFNGFWWWRFDLAISDRDTGTEILSWRGRGCQNSSIRKLNDVLDELEKKPDDTTNIQTKKQTRRKINSDYDLDKENVIVIESDD